jgi:acyl-CoA synthetase (AMP-forming)/AMP-acid ligase II
MRTESASLLAAWRSTLRRHGNRRAVIEAATGLNCTFDELEQRAAAWQMRHVPDATLRGRRVVFAAPNGVGWLTIFLGLLRSGAVIVPLDPGEPASAQLRIATALRASFWWNGAQLAPLHAGRRHRDPEICLIKLTSGTTGQPRPLVFTGSQLLADARQVMATMGIGETDLNYALIPLGHSYGLGNLTVPLIAGGVPIAIGSAPLPQAIAGDFARWRPTVFPGVPAIWRALVAAELPSRIFGSLRRAISAGAPLAPEVAREFEQRFGRRIHAFYGSSETGGIAYDRTGDATLAGGVGRAVRGVRVTKLPRLRLRVCSAAVFASANRHRAANGHGCWVPPDLAQLRRTGEIQLLGRRGKVVKIGGRRLDPAEISARLRQVDGVRDVWIGASDGSEPILGAAVAGARTAAELRAELHRDTAVWKIPKRWLVLEELPLTARGKTDTQALRRRLFG